MASRRSEIQDFYKLRAGGLSLLEKAAASTDRFPFRGSSVAFTVVVRTDLNGYSTWARGRDVTSRVNLLDAFFSAVVPKVEEFGGIYYRDEGDCIVSIFSNYFGQQVNFDKAERFCLNVAAGAYGAPQLGAKCSLACGDVAFFQKAHEIGTADWSAEGEAFVRSARLEQALPSGQQQVAYFATDYDAHFSSTNISATPNISRWVINREKLQIPGLSLAGGWTDVVRLTWRST